MSKKKKSVEELRSESYLCKTDIQRLFGTSKAVASKIYRNARTLDESELGEWIVYKNKVRMRSVLTTQGLKKADVSAK